MADINVAKSICLELDDPKIHPLEVLIVTDCQFRPSSLIKNTFTKKNNIQFYYETSLYKSIQHLATLYMQLPSFQMKVRLRVGTGH